MKIGLCDIYPGKLWKIFKFVEQRHHFDLFIIYPFSNAMPSWLGYLEGIKSFSELLSLYPAILLGICSVKGLSWKFAFIQSVRHSFILTEGKQKAFDDGINSEVFIKKLIFFYFYFKRDSISSEVFRSMIVKSPLSVSTPYKQWE